MIVKFKCHQFPNGKINGVKFEGGFAEIDSIHTSLINDVMKSPFVECLSVVNNTLADAIEEAETLPSTFKNRLIRKNKAEVLKVCDDLGIVIGDKSVTKDFIIDEIMRVKYPAYMEEKVPVEELQPIEWVD